MKKKYKIILLILLSVIFGLIIVFFYFKDEKVRVLKRYDPKTRETITLEYIIKKGDTVFEGKCIYYNEKGKKIAQGNFVNGHIKGKTTNYYDNGKIESIVYRKTSEITEESIYYSPNGKIERYVIYNDLGNPSFIIWFDEKGPREFTGHPLLEIYQYKFSHKKQFNIKTEQVLKVGGVLKYKYLLANIPNTKRSFKIESVGIDNRKIKRTINKVPPTGIEVEEILVKKGVNTIKAIVQYKFNDNVTPVINDTIFFNVNVN